MIKRIKNKVPWTNVINHLNGEEIIGTFYEQERWKGYDNSFNSLIDKKRHCKMTI